MTNRKIEYIVEGQKLQILSHKATVLDACRCMWDCGTGSVLVVDDEERLTGIFTGRDVVRTLAEGKHAELTPLAEAMTPEPVTIDPDARAVDALRKMNDYGFRHLPVVQSGKILGILTRSSFKGMEIDQLDEEIHLWECIR